jgi:hypothetical protein
MGHLMGHLMPHLMPHLRNVPAAMAANTQPGGRQAASRGPSPPGRRGTTNRGGRGRGAWRAGRAR